MTVLAIVWRAWTPVQAQTPAHTFDELAHSVHTGMTVTVTDDSGAAITGRLTELSRSSLSVVVDDRVLRFDQSSVARIQRRVPDSLLNGTAIGAAIGVAPIVALIVAENAGGEPCSGQCTGAVLLSTAVGAGIGAAIDAAIRENRTVFVAVASTSSAWGMRLSPTLTRHVSGAELTVTLSWR